MTAVFCDWVRAASTAAWPPGTGVGEVMNTSGPWPVKTSRSAAFTVSARSPFTAASIKALPCCRLPGRAKKASPA